MGGVGGKGGRWFEGWAEKFDAWAEPRYNQRGRPL